MMMEKITLYTFWTAMLICALLMIAGVWFEARLPEAYFKLAGTFFVIGLANFLLWLPQIAYRFLKKN